MQKEFFLFTRVDNQDNCMCKGKVLYKDRAANLSWDILGQVTFPMVEITLLSPSVHRESRSPFSNAWETHLPGRKIFLLICCRKSQQWSLSWLSQRREKWICSSLFCMCSAAVLHCPDNNSLAQNQPNFPLGLQSNIFYRLTIENDFIGTGPALSSPRGLKSFTQAPSSTLSLLACALHWHPEHKPSWLNLLFI